jgi:hypothetical protein
VGQSLVFTVNAYDANNNAAWMASQYGLPQLKLTPSALASQQSVSLLRVVADAVLNTGAVAGSVEVTSSMSSIVPGQMIVSVVPSMPGLYTIRVLNTTSYVTSQANDNVKYYISSADATPGNTFQITVLPSLASAPSAAVVAARDIEAGGSTSINVSLKDASGSPLPDTNPLLLNVTVFSMNGYAVTDQSDQSLMVRKSASHFVFQPRRAELGWTVSCREFIAMAASPYQSIQQPLHRKTSGLQMQKYTV